MIITLKCWVNPCPSVRARRKPLTALPAPDRRACPRFFALRPPSAASSKKARTSLEDDAFL